MSEQVIGISSNRTFMELKLRGGGLVIWKQSASSNRTFMELKCREIRGGIFKHRSNRTFMELK